jgi:hypothetical protein
MGGYEHVMAVHIAAGSAMTIGFMPQHPSDTGRLLPGWTLTVVLVRPPGRGRPGARGPMGRPASRSEGHQPMYSVEKRPAR